MHLTRQTWIQLAVLSVIAVTTFAYMVFGYMRLPEPAVRHRPLHGDVATARGRRPLRARQRHLPRHRSRRRSRSVDLTDTGVDAVLSLRSDVDDPVQSRSGGAQHLGGRRAVRRAAAPQRGRTRPQERRRHRRGEFQCAAGHQLVARRHQPRAEGDSRRRPDRPRSTRPTPRSADSAPTSAASSGTRASSPSTREPRCRNNSTSSTTWPRSSDTQTDTSDFVAGLGGASGHDHQATAEITTRP